MLNRHCWGRPGGSTTTHHSDMDLTQLDGKFDDPAWQDYCYAVSKDIVSYLIKDYGSQRIQRLLKALGRSWSMEKAFVETYGTTLDEVTRGYDES